MNRRLFLSVVLVLFSIKSLAGSSFDGWLVNEIYSNQSGTVQYVELIATAGANTSFGNSFIDFISDNSNLSLLIQDQDVNPTFFLIANQGFVQTPGTIEPDFLVHGSLFDPLTSVLTIELGSDQYTLDPWLLSNDEFYATDSQSAWVINTPTNNIGETGQLPEAPLFLSDFEFCASPITQYRDADSDNYGNAFDALFSCQLETGYVLDGTDCDDTTAIVNPGMPDQPDLEHIDQNCDGIDGDINDSVFVADGGQGSGLSVSDPTGDLFAAQQLALSNNKSWLLIGVGVYPFGSLVEGAGIEPGVNMAGGYINDFNNRWLTGNTTLNVPYHGASLDSATTNQTLQYIVIQGANDTPASETAYALTVRNSASVNLEQVILFAGVGGDGINGLNGNDGADGNNGTAGGNGVENDSGFSCSTGSQPSRGSGGSSVCGQSGGRGGSPGLEDSNGSPGAAGEGFGMPGNNANLGGSGGVGNSNATDRLGDDGGDGLDGDDGNEGMNGINVIEFVGNSKIGGL